MSLSARWATAACAAAALTAAIPAAASANQVTYNATGDKAAVTTVRDAFRADVGGGTTAAPNGSFGGLRREINWDGVPDGFSAPAQLPAGFFNANSPRGVVFSTPGTGFAVSMDDDVTPGADVDPDLLRFDNVNPTYSTAFGAFSAQRLFTALGSNVTDVHFYVPGTETPATVSSFGVVFTDVDTAGAATLEAFDAAGKSLGKVEAGATPGDGSFSFAGVRYDAGERIAKVRIVSGAGALGVNDVTQGGADAKDVVAMDDFLYAEPVPGLVSVGDDAVAPEGGSATVTVHRSRGTTGAATVDYATADGTAKAGEDYTAKSGTITFAAGETDKTITVPVSSDAAADGGETFSVALSAPTGTALGSDTSATVTIADIPPVAPAPGPVADTTAPKAALALGISHPRVRDLKRGLPLFLGSSESGKVSATLKAGGKTLATISGRSVQAGLTKLTLRASAGYGSAKKAKRAIKATLTAIVTDDAGNKTTITLPVRLAK